MEKGPQESRTGGAEGPQLGGFCENVGEREPDGNQGGSGEGSGRAWS